MKGWIINLMEPRLIGNYIFVLQENYVYTFLDGLDDRLDKIRGDIIQLTLFSIIEQAYAVVRREDLMQ